MDPLRLDVFSDVACPWCFLGKRRLEAALERDGGPVEVRWRAFELNPDVPEEGAPAAAYFQQRFGGLERVAPVHARLVEEGRSVGIAYDFAAAEKVPNTRMAHRAVAVAAERGPEAEAAAVEALFSAYFEQGRDVTDPEVVAEVTGTDAAALRAGAGYERVQADLELGRQVVEGVPLFIADGRLGLPGAQPLEIFERFLAHARAQRSQRAA